MSPLTVLLGLIAGFSIGTVGVGGVILVPVLSFMLGYDLQTAIASSSFSFLFVGVSGTVAYAKRGTIPWKMVAWLTAGIVPGALLGARTNAAVPAALVTLAIAGVLILSGASALNRRFVQVSHRASTTAPQMALVGLVVGYGSALTGTGGPVILVPILLSLGIPTLHAIGTSQAAQIPIAFAATTGYLLFGTIDFTLGVTLGASQAMGVVLGAVIAHRTPPARLRLVVAGALISVGAFIGIRTVL